MFWRICPHPLNLKKHQYLADWATIISLNTKRFEKPLRNVQCGHKFLRVCQNLSLKSKRLEKFLRSAHLDFRQKQFFGVCHNLSLKTKRLEKLLRNGQTGQQFLKVCCSLSLKSKLSEKPRRTGHFRNNSLRFVKIIPLQSNRQVQFLGNGQYGTILQINSPSFP